MYIHKFPCCRCNKLGYRKNPNCKYCPMCKNINSHMCSICCNKGVVYETCKRCKGGKYVYVDASTRKQVFLHNLDTYTIIPFKNPFIDLSKLGL